ncbi:hypothetical protein V5O48_012157 [Marasmius crinis-equi]|uniref:Carbonic anhydrase n=1 Tax=Marasmius crinis-equi TaxID=585013 RepID=A0ABR3F3N7_9AGAR
MFPRTVIATFIYAAIAVQASCLHGTSFLRREVTEEGKVKISNFGYNKENGPANWAQLDPANSLCAAGKNQSPILLDDTIDKAKEKPKVVIGNVEEAEFENLGTTLETIVNGTTTFGGKDFALKQFHLHTPSEHRINEEYFPVEMHMVHESAEGDIAVIAVPFQLSEDGSTTDLLTSVTENINDVKTPGTVTKTGKLEFEELINAIQTKALFQYTGSLTTPPCAEGLTFLVMEEPLPLNVKTYNALKSVIKFNSRFVQNELGKNNVLTIASDDAANAKCGVNAKNETTTTSASEHKMTEVSKTTEEKKMEHKTTSSAAASSTSAKEMKEMKEMKEPMNNEQSHGEEPKVVCAEQCKNKMWRRRYSKLH